MPQIITIGGFFRKSLLRVNTDKNIVEVERVGVPDSPVLTAEHSETCCSTRGMYSFVPARDSTSARTTANHSLPVITIHRLVSSSVCKITERNCLPQLPKDSFGQQTKARLGRGDRINTKYFYLCAEGKSVP